MQFVSKDAKEKRSVLEPLDFWLLNGCGAGGKGKDRYRCWCQSRRQYRTDAQLLLLVAALLLPLLLQKDTNVWNGNKFVVVQNATFDERLEWGDFSLQLLLQKETTVSKGRLCYCYCCHFSSAPSGAICCWQRPDVLWSSLYKGERTKLIKTNAIT